jgi:hypothetical protein
MPAAAAAVVGERSAILIAALPAHILVVALPAATLVLLLLAAVLVQLLLAAVLVLLLLALLAAKVARLAALLLAAHCLAPRGAGVVFGPGKFLTILLGPLDAVLLILVIIELAESRLVAELAGLILLALILVELAHLDILHLEAAGGTAPPFAWERQPLSTISCSSFRRSNQSGKRA